MTITITEHFIDCTFTEGFSKYPVICDADDKILSFPLSMEIIPLFSRHYRLFIDVTGWDYRSCGIVVLIAIQLMERGGFIS